MKRTTRSRQRGAAAMEFLFCLQLLLLLALPVADLARVLQAEMILTNIAREGANLAARTGAAEQTIMESLAATTPPLDMRRYGAIHITKVLAHRSQGVVRNVVIAQHRWVNGTYMPRNGIWTCGANGTYWGANGGCAALPPPEAAPEVDLMRGQLKEGEVAYLVEAFYRFPLLFGGLEFGESLRLPGFNPDLYAFTVL